jgi:hypothetical protein
LEEGQTKEEMDLGCTNGEDDDFANDINSIFSREDLASSGSNFLTGGSNFDTNLEENQEGDEEM